MAGKWQTVALPPSVTSGAFNAGTMLLMTDGTVLASNSGGSNNNNGGSEWLRFTPDPVNFYVGGAWGNESDMTNTRLFFASGILRDARMFAIGGEVSTAGSDTPLGEIFDPIANKWSQMTALDKPASFNFIQGDASSCVLPDGRVLFGALNATSTAIWDPLSSSWTQAGTAFGTKPDTKTGWCNEETWTLLPDGSVLTVNIKVPTVSGGSTLEAAPTSAERYVPSADIWIPTNPLPDVLALTTVFDSVTNAQVPVYEMGPAILLPDKTLIAFGGTGHTARFTPDPVTTNPGSWVAGPDFPNDPNTTVYPAKILTLSDAPAVLQPNGRVIVVAGTLYRNTSSGVDFFSKNSQFFEYDPLAPVATSLTLLAQPGNGATSQDTWTTRFLLLPTGQIALSNEQPQVLIYTTDPAEPSYQAAWQPTITSFPTTLIIGHSYLLTGTGLNGISQANSYGDDAQMATNYPIVQITDTVNNNVYYLRTQDFSTLGVDVAGSQTASVTVVQGTPPGAYNLVVIANGIPSAPFAVEIGTQDIGFLLQENEFGGGQVQAQINLAGTPAVYQTVLYVTVEGFTLADCGITTAASLLAPGNQPTVSSPQPKMTFTYSGTTLVEDLTFAGPQVIQFPFQVSFADASMFQDPTLFPPGAEQASVTLTATFTPPGAPPLTVQAAITLIKTPNPFILHNDPNSTDPTVQQAWYLSMDLRVFQIEAGQSRFGKAVANTGDAVADATGYITQVISNLNGDKAVADTLFGEIPENEDDAALNLAPANGSTPVYNFALARVRTQDVAPADDVRVFFRMWAAQQTNAVYDPNTTYASRPNPAGEKIPVLGVQNAQIITIPFFAAPRANNTSAVSLATQTDPANVQAVIAADPLGAEVHTFFGCWLDINQPNAPLFPALVQGDAAGPFTGEGPLLPIQSFARSDHQCLIAEISYDPDPPPVGSDPSNTDKLAQRNLAFVNVPNPGHPHSRVVPQTFEIRPSPAVLRSDGRPDELMIQWGNLPHGSIASIYLPGVTSTQILDLATRLYTTHRLTAADANTIQTPVGGVSYVPIPQGGTVNFAGLLTLDLPATVKKGQLFNVVVRQITSVGGAAGRDGGQITAVAAVREGRPWRAVLGQFALKIPVSTKHELLGGEEERLSIMRWIGQSIPVASRWYPVFQRYLQQLTGRVTFMGGNPVLVNPSPTGVWQIPYEPGGPGHGGPSHGGPDHGGPGHGDPGHEPEGDRHIGKVDGLIYDHFGDFDGFVLESFHGHRHRFHTREVRMEEQLLRAREERLVTTVTSANDGRVVLSIVFGRR